MYEALQQAEKGSPVQQTGKGRPVQQDDTVVSLYPNRNMVYSVDAEIQKKMVTLYWNIRTRLGEQSNQIIQFINTGDNKESSVVVCQFAKTLALNFSKSILLLDATLSGEQLDYFQFAQSKNIWANILLKNQPVTTLFHTVPGTQLSIAPFSVNARPITSMVEWHQLENYLSEIQQHFDVILIDTPAPALSADSIAITGLAHGVVMVVEAGETRWQVAENIKQEIEKNAGNVVGVFLNKKKHHIPKFVYRRL
jgi:Mrp family chromosome partitioning ATPase